MVLDSFGSLVKLSAAMSIFHNSQIDLINEAGNSSQLKQAYNHDPALKD